MRLEKPIIIQMNDVRKERPELMEIVYRRSEDVRHYLQDKLDDGWEPGWDTAQAGSITVTWVDDMGWWESYVDTCGKKDGGVSFSAMYIGLDMRMRKAMERVVVHELTHCFLVELPTPRNQKLRGDGLLPWEKLAYEVANNITDMPSEAFEEFIHNCVVVSAARRKSESLLQREEL